MTRANGRAASGFGPKLKIRAKSLSLKSLESLDKSRAKGCAASGFKTKLHSSAKCMSPESLDLRSEMSGNESRQGSRRILI